MTGSGTGGVVLASTGTVVILSEFPDDTFLCPLVLWSIFFRLPTGVFPVALLLKVVLG